MFGWPGVVMPSGTDTPRITPKTDAMAFFGSAVCGITLM